MVPTKIKISRTNELHHSQKLGSMMNGVNWSELVTKPVVVPRMILPNPIPSYDPLYLNAIASMSAYPHREPASNPKQVHTPLVGTGGKQPQEKYN